MFDPNELKALGINFDEAIERFMGKQNIYDKFLKKFPGAVSQYEVYEYFIAKDYEKALANAHTLKGVTGNLSITNLFEAYTEIVADLRGNDPQKAQEILESILPVQDKIVNYINENSD